MMENDNSNICMLINRDRCQEVWPEDPNFSSWSLTMTFVALAVVLYVSLGGRDG